MVVSAQAPFRAAPLVWEAQPGHFSLTLCVKATFRLVHGAPAQPLPEPRWLGADQTWDDEPLASLYAPSDYVPFKPRVDILLVGHVYAPADGADTVLARLRVGSFEKALRVFGDRRFRRERGELVRGAPERFEKMPLRYERAARSPDNPVGFTTGIEREGAPSAANIEAVHAHHAPVFAPIAPGWAPRRVLLDDRSIFWAYEITRGASSAPGPSPRGLDFAFFNCAPREQQVETIRANAPLSLENLQDGRALVSTRLPGLRPVARRRDPQTGRQTEIALRIDTVWIDSDRGEVSISWRGLAELGSQSAEVGEIVIEPDERRTVPPPAPEPEPDDPTTGIGDPLGRRHDGLDPALGKSALGKSALGKSALGKSALGRSVLGGAALASEESTDETTADEGSTMRLGPKRRTRGTVRMSMDELPDALGMDDDAHDSPTTPPSAGSNDDERLDTPDEPPTDAAHTEETAERIPAPPASVAIDEADGAPTEALSPIRDSEPPASGPGALSRAYLGGFSLARNHTRELPMPDAGQALPFVATKEGESPGEPGGGVHDGESWIDDTTLGHRDTQPPADATDDTAVSEPEDDRATPIPGELEQTSDEDLPAGAALPFSPPRAQPHEDDGVLELPPLQPSGDTMEISLEHLRMPATPFEREGSPAPTSPSTTADSETDTMASTIPPGPGETIDPQGETLAASQAEAPLGVTPFARLVARMARAEERQVLRDEGVDPERFATSREHWSRVLAAEAERGEESTRTAFEDAFTDELERELGIAYGSSLYASFAVALERGTLASLGSPYGVDATALSRLVRSWRRRHAAHDRAAAERAMIEARSAP